MKHLVTSTYTSLEDFVSDIIRYDDLITNWEKKYPGYHAKTECSVDGGEFYTIMILCNER